VAKVRSRRFFCFQETQLIKTLRLVRVALCMSVAAVMLAGCGGSQPPTSTPGVMPQSRTIAAQAARGGSWQPGKAKSTLLYATGGCSGVCVITYPSGSVVGSISAPAFQDCANSSRDVFVTAYPSELHSEVLEYAHGGTTPIATLTIPGDSIAGGCAVDPTTGNLAVVYGCPDCGGPAVAIFPNSQGTPTIYEGGFTFSFCAYDNSGNLFIDGFSLTNGKDVGFAELAKGSQSLSYIAAPQSLRGTGYPWQMQWDGKYMTYEAAGSAQSSWGVTIYRLAFAGSTATVVGQTHFRGVTRSVGQSWIQGNKVFIPYGVRGNGISHPKIGVWRYPAGGKPIEIFKPSLENRPHFEGVAGSIAPV
jgi:hypothetical protein